MAFATADDDLRHFESPPSSGVDDNSADDELGERTPSVGRAAIEPSEDRRNATLSRRQRNATVADWADTPPSSPAMAANPRTVEIATALVLAWMPFVVSHHARTDVSRRASSAAVSSAYMSRRHSVASSHLQLDPSADSTAFFASTREQPSFDTDAAALPGQVPVAQPMHEPAVVDLTTANLAAHVALTVPPHRRPSLR